MNNVVINGRVTTIMKVNENEIRVIRLNNEDYISLTDLARYKNPGSQEKL